MNQSAEDGRGPGKWMLTSCLAVMLLTAALRALSLTNDFWLDEIWAHRMAMQISGAGDVFFRLHHSNNHHLMTLITYWLGDQDHWMVYRLPSLFSGIGTVVVGFLWARRRSELQALYATVLLGFCFALVQFSSEARGYAPVVFLCVLAFYLADLDRERPRARLQLAYGAAVSLAFLCHLTALFFAAGLGAAWLFDSRGQEPRSRILQGLRMHGVPLAVFAILYTIDIRHLLVDSGDQPRADLLTAQVAGYTLGLPVWRTWAWPFAVLFTLPLLGVVLRLARSGQPRWLTYSVTIVLAPLVVIATMRPDVIALRYFLIGIAFYLLALSEGLAWITSKLRYGRAAVAAVLVLFVGGNLAHAGAFLRDGRGGYHEALRHMMALYKPEVRVGSDHDFRNGMALEFYTPHVPHARKLRYYRQDDWPASGLDWVIVHGEERDGEPAPGLDDNYGHVYRLDRSFEHAGVSGFFWDLYRRSR